MEVQFPAKVGWRSSGRLRASIRRTFRPLTGYWILALSHRPRRRQDPERARAGSKLG